MLMTAEAYLRRGGSADDAAIRRELAGNLCRCTGYQHIARGAQGGAQADRTPTGDEDRAAWADGTGPTGTEPGVRGDADTATLLRPRSPAEALRLIERQKDALPIAGGTDLMVAWNAGGLAGRTFLDLASLRAWRASARRSRPWCCGSPLSELRATRSCAATSRCGRSVRHGRRRSDPEPRNDRGNLANASPAARHLPAVAVYEALVTVVSTGPAGVPLPTSSRA
jgi:xanthine dehydrogenase iron-sulfur cluster and FAD-binding subunit A